MPKQLGGGQISLSSSYNTLADSAGSESCFALPKTLLFSGLSLSISKSYSSNPLESLKSLITTLKEHGISGPFLFRLRKEINCKLGSGAQSTVYGAGEDTLRNLQRMGRPMMEIFKQWSRIAIKQSRARNPDSSSSSGSHDLGLHLQAAQREIITLCDKDFRKHRNIVSLLGWGLCLDTLEDENKENLRIPLLVLERAQYNLQQFLVATRHSAQTIRMLCVDVGAGLEALHSKDITHGDLKCDNVLVFKDRSGFVAKLCDFGLTRGVENFEAWSSDYYGTPGWRPPEVLNKKERHWQTRDFVQCDVYAYGLVVWAAYNNKGQYPLHLHEHSSTDDRSTHVDKTFTAQDRMEGSINVLDAAVSDLEQSLVVRGRHRSAILAVFRASLQHEPALREQQPWQYLRRHSIPTRSYIEFGISCIEKSRYEITSTFRNIVHKRSFIPTPDEAMIYAIQTVRTIYDKFVHPRVPEDQESQLLHDHFYSNPGLLMWSLEHFGVGTDSSFYNSPAHSWAHCEASCADLQPLINHKHETIDTLLRGSHLVPSVAAVARADLYTICRVRSYFNLCCWEKALQRYQLQNKRQHPFYKMVESPALDDPRIDFATIAWLCHGPIGEHDLTEAPNVGFFPPKASQLGKLNQSQRLERFLLLVDKGWHIERVFRVFVESLSPEVSSKAVAEVCRRFKLVQNDSRISRLTRYYMTGVLPESGDVSSAFNRTALHDCADALLYGPVEQLVRWNMVVDALDDRKETALQTAYRSSEKAGLLSERRRVDRDRIFALLRQKAGAQSTVTDAAIYGGVQLPQGWEYREILLAEKSYRGDHLYYVESYMGSVTFCRPTFSFYDARRLALGFRTSSGIDQRYYLDFISFISQDNKQRTKIVQDTNVKNRFPIIGAEFLSAEIAGSIMKEDIFARLVRLNTEDAEDAEDAPAAAITGFYNMKKRPTPRHFRVMHIARS